MIKGLEKPSKCPIFRRKFLEIAVFEALNVFHLTIRVKDLRCFCQQIMHRLQNGIWIFIIHPL
jgi:hypothetical protein